MSATTIVRPEFQLQVAGLDFTSSSGVEVKAGTIYGRLFFPVGCTVQGSFKGRILKDSWNTGAKYSTNRKVRVIEFIASPETYSKLASECASSSMVSVRVRTCQLLESCFAAPSADIPADVQAARTAAESERVRRVATSTTTAVLVSQPCESVRNISAQFVRAAKQLCLPAAPVDTMREVLEAKTVKQLRHIAKVYGVVLGHCNKAELIEILYRQFTRRNINPVQIRTCK